MSPCRCARAFPAVSAVELGLRSYVAVDACAALDESELQTFASPADTGRNRRRYLWGAHLRESNGQRRSKGGRGLPEHQDAVRLPCYETTLSDRWSRIGWSGKETKNEKSMKENCGEGGETEEKKLLADFAM